MLAKLMLVLILSCLRATATAAVPPEIAGSKVYKVWQFSGSAESWGPGNNIGPFTLKNGILSFTNIGADPWILNTNVGGADTSKYGFLGIKMRSSVSGDNQAFFVTDKTPLGEAASMHFPVQGDGKFHFYEINLSKLKTWEGKLGLIRMDVANGGSEIGAKVDIDWIALYQAPARVVITSAYIWEIEAHKPYLGLTMRNIGGRPVAGVVVTADDKPWKVQPLAAGESRNELFPVKDDRNGHTMRGWVGKKTLFDIKLAASKETDQVRSLRLCDGAELKLAESSTTDGKRRVHGAVMWIGRASGLIVRLELPLELVYRDRGGVFHCDEIAPDSCSISANTSTATFRAKRKLAGGTANLLWTVTALSHPDRSVTGDVMCELRSDAPLDVLRFQGPQLVSWSSPDHAIFPGLQYLEAHEPYTATQFIGPKLADQHIPHPYKIAIPLMAGASDASNGGVYGVTWDPLQEWAPGHRLPCSQFEPSRMGIFAPSVPEFVEENHNYATTPYTLRPGSRMKLTTSYFLHPKMKIEDVIPDYLKSHPLKRTLDSAKVEKVVETCFKAYAGTLYSAKDKGWKTSFGAHEVYAFNPGYAAKILGESLRTGNAELARKVGVDPNGQIAQYMGTTLDWFSPGARAAADAAIARQSADGGFPYQIDDEMRKKVRENANANGGVDTDVLGTLGETNEGLIARELTGILDYAVHTGGQKYIDAGIKGLAKLNSFTVPRGAQTWEVHAHAPDVYAAALGIVCNVAGYRLTGDQKYLDYATFWAKTGLPFIYSWIPPINPVPAAVVHFDQNGEGKQPVLDKPSLFYSDTKRYINPGASIAVFGSSFYFVSWFGVPVQWCGLAWADSVQPLMALRKDAVLQSVADAVFVSGTQQQFDKGWAAGAFPDSWGLAPNTANAVLIGPDAILPYAYGALDEKDPGAVSTSCFKGVNGQSCLNSYARVESLAYEAMGQTLRAKLKLYAGQDVYSCITNTDAPSRVTVDGIDLRDAVDLKAAPAGWFYDAENRVLHLKYRSTRRVAEAIILWPDKLDK